MSTHAPTRRGWRRLPRVPALAALATPFALLAFAGCGGSSKTSSSAASASPESSSATQTSASSGSTSGNGHALSLAADTEGKLKFTSTSLSAAPGKVTISFKNAASLSHNLTVTSSSGTVVGATPTFQGGSRTLSLNLKPGVYKFYCSVPGHRAAGMEGSLTVASPGGGSSSGGSGSSGGEAPAKTSTSSGGGYGY